MFLAPRFLTPQNPHLNYLYLMPKIIRKEIELAGGGMPGQQEDEFDLGLEDWRKEADYDI